LVTCEVQPLAIQNSACDDIIKPEAHLRCDHLTLCERLCTECSPGTHYRASCISRERKGTCGKHSGLHQRVEHYQKGDSCDNWVPCRKCRGKLIVDDPDCRANTKDKQMKCPNNCDLTAEERKRGGDCPKFSWGRRGCCSDPSGRKGKKCRNCGLDYKRLRGKPEKFFCKSQGTRSKLVLCTECTKPSFSAAVRAFVRFSKSDEIKLEKGIVLEEDAYKNRQIGIWLGNPVFIDIGLPLPGAFAEQIDYEMNGNCDTKMEDHEGQRQKFCLFGSKTKHKTKKDCKDANCGGWIQGIHKKDADCKNWVSTTSIADIVKPMAEAEEKARKAFDARVESQKK